LILTFFDFYPWELYTQGYKIIIIIKIPVVLVVFRKIIIIIPVFYTPGIFTSLGYKKK